MWQWLCLAAGLSLLAGCRHPLELRVVDSATGEPVAAAQVHVTQVNYRLIMHRVTRDLSALSADQAGRIVVTGLRSSHDFAMVRAPGYEAAQVGYVGPSQVGVISPYPPRDPNPATLWQKQTNSSSKRPVVVPIHSEEGKNLP